MKTDDMTDEDHILLKELLAKEQGVGEQEYAEFDDWYAVEC